MFVSQKSVYLSVVYNILNDLSATNLDLGECLKLQWVGAMETIVHAEYIKH